TSDDPLQPGLTDLKDTLAEAAQVRNLKQAGHPEKRRKRELDPAMDYLINAEKHAGLMCRRKVFDVCFENDAADGWREQTTATVYGWHHLNDMGPSIMMWNATVERIIDCAHHRKITSVPELKRETGWSDADQFGSEIIALVQRHAAPLPTPFVSTPLRLTASGTVNTALPLLLDTAPASPCPPPNTSAPKRKNRCGACGQEGHNARNRTCSKHPSHTATAAGKENVHILFAFLSILS
ncbi:hypothetical protein PAXINDRAFT_82527, partial [Paxillus involutus ATCC 200175]